MLKKILPKTELLNKQILRCESIIALEPKLRADKNLNFDVVAEKSNDQMFRCLWGHVKESVENAPDFDCQDIACWLGCSKQDALNMFGHSSNKLYLSNRLDYLKCHLSSLKRSIHSV